MTKAELRKTYREIRGQLSGDGLEQFNALLLARLKGVDWHDKTYIHTFLPIVQHNEPDMWKLIDFLRSAYQDKHIVVSRSNAADYSMDNFLLSEGVVLQKNAWGIVEPVDGERVDEKLLDVVIVPLLVADRHGNRIGYGKGFYDRFLARCRPDCLKIGISYFEPVALIEDVGPFDVPLDQLVTPERTYHFSGQQ